MRLFPLNCCFISAAVVAIIKLPVATSNASVAEAGMRAVHSLAIAAENTAKLGSAGACEGGWVGG